MGHPSVTLPPGHWPDLDRQLWAAANQPGDVLEPGDRAAAWKPNTRRQVEKDYGRLLFWLGSSDELDSDQMPGARLTPARLEAYLSHLRSTNMATISVLSRMRGVLQAIGAIDPDASATLTRLRNCCARLKRQATPRRQKHLRVVDPAILVDVAFADYGRLFQSGAPMGIRACNHARDALMLAFLAFHPIRLGNFAGLRIGHEITFGERRARLMLNASQTKEHRAYEAEVAEDLIPYLMHYLHEVRPLLLDGQVSDGLWVSMRGGPLSESAIYYQTIKITRRLIGHEMNPHLVRDCALTSFAEWAPHRVHAGAALLGHADLSIGEQHYNHAGVVSAQVEYFETIRAIRRRANDRNVLNNSNAL